MHTVSASNKDAVIIGFDQEHIIFPWNLLYFIILCPAVSKAHFYLFRKMPGGMNQVE